MPFKSLKQMRAAFGGYLGKKMKNKAEEWADETPNIGNLPKKVKKSVRGSGVFTTDEISQGYKKL